MSTDTAEKVVPVLPFQLGTAWVIEETYPNERGGNVDATLRVDLGQGPELFAGSGPDAASAMFQALQKALVRRWPEAVYLCLASSKVKQNPAQSQVTLHFECQGTKWHVTKTNGTLQLPAILEALQEGVGKWFNANHKGQQ